MSVDRVELAVRELVAALRAELTPEPEPSALVSVTDACRMLGIGRTSLYVLMDAGELPSLHVGRRRLLSRHDVETYASRPMA